MRKSGCFLLLLFLGVLTIPAVQSASAHSAFNSNDETIGNYEVQVATIPEIPAANEPFKLEFRVLNYVQSTNYLNSFNTQNSEVDHFRMGVRIFYNDKLIDTIPPQSHDGGQWDTTYTFHEPGNHVFEVDLYDVGKNGETYTYDFNVSAVNIFGPIFVYIISAGGLGAFVLIIWAVITKRRMKAKP
jgi:hypothetical protein